MRQLFFAFALLICAAPAQSQLLKKLKDKVNKSIDKATGSDDSSGSKSSAETSSGNDNNSKSTWCDTVKTEGIPGADSVAYTLAYSSPGKMDIVYAESSLGLSNDPNGYRLILSTYVNGKTQFVVVENGKVVATDKEVKKEYLGKGSSDQFSVGSEDRNEEMQKYLIADSLKYNTPKTGAKSATIQKVDENQMDMALTVARQTDDYKNMTAEEKKEFEETMKKGMQQHNAMAGQTISIPAQQGGSFSTVTGYKLIVKGKNYGKFTYPPAVYVSKDEANVFAVGMDDKANPIMISNAKKTILDKGKYMAVNGKILVSPDGTKAVYMEMKQMSSEELNDVSSGKAKMSYTVLKRDGTSMIVTDYNSSGKFTLTNSGALLSINETTGEVYSDGKKLGKFAQSNGSFNSDAILMGADVSKLAYYDGSNGSLNYLDGSTRKLGVMYPKVISQNGKSYLTWFRKCRNNIYIAKFQY